MNSLEELIKKISERSITCEYCRGSHLVHECQTCNSYFFDFSYEQSYVVSSSYRYIDSSEYNCNPECNQYSQEDQYSESKPFQEENGNLEKIMHTLFQIINERIAYNYKATMDLTMKVNELISIVKFYNDGELSNETASCTDEIINEIEESYEKEYIAHNEKN